MKGKCIMVLIVCAIAVVATLNVAYAGTAMSAQLKITDTSDNVKGAFAPGEDIVITWHSISPPGATVNVWITDLDGQVVTTLAVNRPADSATWSTTIVGYYYVWCTGAPAWPIAVGSFHVIPESLLGTLMATAVGFAAFGIFRFQRQRLPLKK